MSRPFDLRPARPGDEALLLAWRNDDETRRWSLETNPVDAATHARWFRSRLAQPDATRIYIAEVNSQPVGQARLDRRDGAKGEISVGLDAGARGMGLGTGLIRAASTRGAAELDLDCILAVIKVGNEPSARAFTRAGFVLVDHGERCGAEVLIYRLDERRAA